MQNCDHIVALLQNKNVHICSFPLPEAPRVNWLYIRNSLLRIDLVTPGILHIKVLCTFNFVLHQPEHSLISKYENVHMCDHSHTAHGGAVCEWCWDQVSSWIINRTCIQLWIFHGAWKWAETHSSLAWTCRLSEEGSNGRTDTQKRRKAIRAEGFGRLVTAIITFGDFSRQILC